VTNKQRAFIDNYLMCWNATEAARRAGYKYPNVQGSQNLVKLSIKAEIERRISEQTMSADEVLSRLADQARGDLANFADVESIKDLPENNQSHVVKKVKTTHRKFKDDSESITFEIELHDSQAALVHIGKHHGLFVEKHQHEGQVDIVEMSLEEWKQQQAEKRQQTAETLADFDDNNGDEDE
jgi:phage terminase small subunit